MVYIFEYIDKSPDDDNSVIVINGDVRAATVGATMTGYCSEDDARHGFSIQCINPVIGEWRLKWDNYSSEDTLEGLNAEIALGDIISRMADGSNEEWEYTLKQID